MLRIVFTGVGGQGIITAGIILAEAAVICEGRYATQTQSYGAEARGGLTRTDVILSDSEILFPKIEQAHVVAALHQRGYEAHSGVIRPGGLLITDQDQVKVAANKDARRFGRPILSVGRGANIAMLGVVVALTDAVSRDALRETVIRRYGEKSHNVEALEAGFAMAQAS